jgi:hypothetical protein
MSDGAEESARGGVCRSDALIAAPRQVQHAVALLEAQCASEKVREQPRGSARSLIWAFFATHAPPPLPQVAFDAERCSLLHTAPACGAEPATDDVVAVHGRR